MREGEEANCETPMSALLPRSVRNDVASLFPSGRPALSATPRRSRTPLAGPRRSVAYQQILLCVADDAYLLRYSQPAMKTASWRAGIFVDQHRYARNST
jgi:hypothetical protein